MTFLTDEKGEKRILFYELTWSEITRPQKELLAYDYSSLYADRRVVFNRMMKQFLDNALPDAVYYIGSRRRLIQQSAEQAMCWMLKTDWQTLPDFQKGICLMSPAEQVRAVAAQKMLFITHSLGSKIFIDAFTALAEDMQKAEAGRFGGRRPPGAGQKADRVYDGQPAAAAAHLVGSGKSQRQNRLLLPVRTDAITIGGSSAV